MQNKSNQPSLFSDNDGNSSLFGPANTSSSDSATSSLFDTKAGSQDSKQAPLLLFQDTKSQAPLIHPPNSTLPTTQSQNPTSTAPMQNSQADVHVDGLKQEDLEAFKADQFVLGKIPEHPPPLDLC